MEKIQGYLEPIDAALVAKAKTNKESFGANIQIHGKWILIVNREIIHGTNLFLL